MQNLLSTVSNVALGDLPLMNTIFGAEPYNRNRGGEPSYFLDLPDWTSVAQSNNVRPFYYAEQRRKIVDWNRIVSYDFAGPPECKPWIVYAFQKKKQLEEIGDEKNYMYAHPYLGVVKPGSDEEQIYMIPQWLWNEHYDQVLKRKKKGRSTYSI